jgi:hypothetical protein
MKTAKVYKIFHRQWQISFMTFTFYSICHEPGCGVSITEENVSATETGAGLKIKSGCKKHRKEWESAEFFNQELSYNYCILQVILFFLQNNFEGGLKLSMYFQHMYFLAYLQILHTLGL